MKTKVFVGVPVRYHNGKLEDEVIKCLEMAKAYGEEKKLYDMTVMKWGGQSITQNSYKLINAFLDDHPDYTHFLYTGDDLTFPPDGIQSLLDAKKPVIAGCSTWKTPPYFVNAGVLDESGHESKIHITVDMLRAGAVVEVFCIGSGFMLIERKVLEDVRALWEEYFRDFRAFMPRKFRKMVPVPYFPVLYDTDDKGFRSSDYSFCETAKVCGHTIWLHCGVIIGHIWRKQYSVLDHLNWRDKYGMAQEEPTFPTEKIESVEYVMSKFDGEKNEQAAA